MAGLDEHFKMDGEFRAVENGNIAITAEIDLPPSGEFTVAIACGEHLSKHAAKLLQSLATPFESHRQGYVRQWQRAGRKSPIRLQQRDLRWRAALPAKPLCVAGPEDKLFQGAMVASMSIPWGETKGDGERGGYHLVLDP